MSNIQAPKIIGSIFDIQDQYQVFIFDQWGVLHDGITPYPAVLEALVQLKKKDKKIVMLSNSGRVKEINKQRLKDKGFDTTIFEDIVTSGEAFKKHVKSELFQCSESKAFCISVDETLMDWQELGIEFTTNASKAGWVLLSFLQKDFDEDQVWQALKPALKFQLPLYCVNPDVLIVGAKNTIYQGPGYIAKKYLEAGGEVHFFGKPHPYVYDLCKKSFPTVPANEVLCIGDSLEHDVAGAFVNGFDSLFIGQGIFNDRLRSARNIKSELQKLIFEFKTCPTFYAFSWC